MPPHRVTVQKPVVPKIEDGAIHGKDRKRNRRSVEEKLVEGEFDQWGGADDNIRRIPDHRRDPAHIRSQNLSYHKRNRIDTESVKHLNSQRDNEESHRDDVKERSHTSSQ